MCQNATKTAASLMKAIEPTLINLMTLSGVATLPEGQAAIKAYDAALVAVENWQSGTPAQTVIEFINAFTSVFDTLPIAGEYGALVNIIAAGIVTVIGVLTANSPAPIPITQAAALAPPEEAASDEEISAHYQAHVMAHTTAKVQQLVPGFKRSIFTSPASQYKKAWNQAVEKGKLDPALTA